ncbi:hypothetical protein HUE58_04030 [Candidatus Ruthia endofausta]|uniref:MvaI/BcnI restriction endonuclease domain-containing protein n=1 Tax=Candidatus Ruthia endofausta TaxID=2738852 RepID=A0A6N0HPS1_9GAMM|nr:MvaI/BcnI family restriction endonuclease [Candidatus Ruthia endofausta]QKQ24306.1 hypothetical protein HUE58_04030 [Candidatus Ruthia endofausta]
MSETAEELLNKLILVSSKGFIPTVIVGDTDVRMTLETGLGIKANSNKEPNYKGIESKSSRVSENKKKRE